MSGNDTRITADEEVRALAERLYAADQGWTYAKAGTHVIPWDHASDETKERFVVMAQNATPPSPAQLGASDGAVRGDFPTIRRALAAMHGIAPGANIADLRSLAVQASVELDTPPVTPARLADSAVRDLIAAATLARDVLQKVSLLRRKIGPLATQAQSAAWQIASALNSIEPQNAPVTPARLADSAVREALTELLISADRAADAHNIGDMDGAIVQARVVLATQPVSDDRIGDSVVRDLLNTLARPYRWAIENGREVEKCDFHLRTAEGWAGHLQIQMGDSKRAHEYLADTTQGGRTDAEDARRIVRHKKRGTLYEVLGEAGLQSEQPVGDDARLVVYRGLDKGDLWARPPAEFEDGRFEEAAMSRDAALSAKGEG